MAAERRRGADGSGRPTALVATALAMALVLLVPRGAAGQHPAEGFAIAPYLLEVTTEAATVAFHLREPRPAELRVEMGGAWRTVSSPEPRRAHFVRVTGLEPGRTYPYEVVATDDVRTPTGDRSFEIRTAVRPGESFTFVVYGDPRPGETGTDRHHRLVLGQVAQTEPAFSLVLGDLVDDGSDARGWEAFFSVEAGIRRRAAIYPVLGDNDHAAGRGRAADYFPWLARGPYRFEWGGVQFFGMNAWGALGEQPAAELDEQSSQLAWLDAALSDEAARRAPFRIVFLHDPIYLGRGRSAELLRRLWAPLLARRGVDLVLASAHLYERSRHDGVTYVVTGGAGAELVWPEPNPAFPSQAEAQRHHFCRIDVESGALQLRAIAEDGTVLDSLTLLPQRRDGPDGAASLRAQAERLGRSIHVGTAPGRAELTAYLFATECSYCDRLIERDLPAWARRHEVALRLLYFDLALPGAYDLLVAAGADFGRQDADLPALFVGRAVLGGEREISSGLDAELERFRADPAGYRAAAITPFRQAHDTAELRTERFAALRLPVVLAAGLVDGINPCAFTTVIFLISYLGVTGGSRRRLLLAGGLFTLGVLVAYFAIGLAFYEVASTLMGHGIVATVVHVAMLAALLLLALLSAIDAVRCLVGKPTDIALKLPRALQERVRSRIRAFARSERAGGAAAFTLGVVIAGLELACTGQIYLPIVTMIAEPQHRAEATLGLLVYNLAFILPLCVVFLLAAFGVGSERLARFARRHVATAKIAMTLLLLGLALIVVHNLGWLT